MAETNTKPPSEEGLSKLPESILCHILSFVTTKEAARTSILSKQWQHLWTSVPVLDVNATDICTQHNSTFQEIIFKILQSRQQGQPIRKVSLFCDSECDYVNLGYLLAALATRYLQEFDLCIDHRSPVAFELPRCLWSCNTHPLVVLRLRGPIAIRVDSSSSVVEFPKLKVLHLNNVCFKGDGSVPNLLLCCPLLDELVIRNASKSATKVTVKSRALKRLTYDESSSTAFAFQNID